MVERSTPTFADLESSASRLISTNTLPAADELRRGDVVICPSLWGASVVVDAAREVGAHVIAAPYRFEDVRLVSQRNRRIVRTAATRLVAPPKGARLEDTNYVEANIDAATSSFARTWDALSTPVDADPVYTPASDLVPASWVPYLPYPTYNPAQVQALDAILSPRPALIVAPTGAGKTMLGMTAALQTIMEQGRKAAWLVPQRSLTAELDRELDTWRAQGLKVVALSGESRADLDATREADLWVATTEKFESLCRSTSMKDAVSEIGVIIVDEIHLLGEPGRGPVLETLLARIQASAGHVRLVGLSATATNAEEVARWLGADLTVITWRPTRLTQQIVSLSADSSRAENAQRTAAATAIAQEVTGDGGSVIVFCGTKRNVRSTALAIAQARGVDTRTVQINDANDVYAATAKAGVGLHYSDWPHKKQAESDFRERRTDVLVATSTLAAGVNLPARAVVVRDTTIGGDDMEVSMVQQMFGRAGRAGKESEGWAFLLCTLGETSTWRRKIAAGYTIRSGILGNLADHLLAEVVQGNILSLPDAEQWWQRTLAYHQGDQDTRHVRAARDFLMQHGFLAAGDGEGAPFVATPLGLLTCRMMIPVADASRIIGELDSCTPPQGPKEAENALLVALTSAAAPFADAVPGSQPDVAAAMAALKRFELAGSVDLSANARHVPGGVMSVIALAIALRVPETLHPRNNKALGLTRSALMPAVYESVRYLSWISALPGVGSAPAWVACVGLDVGRRIAWHQVCPPRGAGRVLWACELLTRSDPEGVRSLYAEAHSHGAGDIVAWPSSDSATLADAGRRLAGKRAAFTVARDGTVRAGENCQVVAAREDDRGLWVDAPRSGRQPLLLEAADGAAIVSSYGDAVGFGWLTAFAAAS